MRIKMIPSKIRKIYDITIDGISLVTNYRNGFSKIIKSDGIDGLIARLRDKNTGS